MMLGRIRWRLTLGYIGIFTVILVPLAAAAIFGFWRELVHQQDFLLTQEARNQTSNLLNDEHREVLATGSAEFTWVALDPDGRVTDRDPSATTLGNLGLPSATLAEQALEEDGVVSATIRGQQGRVRAVSVPMYDSGELVGMMQYARSLQQPEATVRQLVLVLLPLGLGGLGLATLGGFYMSGRAARPAQAYFERQRAFIADASHELKTPLTLIKADAEVVLYRGDVNPEDRKLIEHALAETDRMSAVLSDLLLVARLDADKLEVAREPFDLPAVVSEAIGRFGARAAARGVRLEVHTSSAKLMARGDPEHTRQILAALLDNAIRFTPPEGRVSVTGQRQARWVEVVVRDTGPGIAPEHLPRIFDRFYRASTARTRGSGGAGLGLAIARALAEAQGGNLTAENVKGGGTVFRLRLLGEE